MSGASAITTPDEVRELGTILSVWAHPDDESFACAALMAAAAKNGQRVVCVTATRGEKGVQDPTRWPPELLGAIRARELEQALSILGINEHHFLNIPDGSCDDMSIEEGAERIRHFIKVVKPNTILTFGPEGYTGHPDHQAVSAWVSHAVKEAEPRPTIYHWVEDSHRYATHLVHLDRQFNIFFNIEKPPLKSKEDCTICFCSDNDCATLKKRALEAMPSQTEALLSAATDEMIASLLAHELFIKADS